MTASILAGAPFLYPFPPILLLFLDFFGFEGEVTAGIRSAERGKSKITRVKRSWAQGKILWKNTPERGGRKTCAGGCMSKEKKRKIWEEIPHSRLFPAAARWLHVSSRIKKFHLCSRVRKKKDVRSRDECTSPSRAGETVGQGIWTFRSSRKSPADASGAAPTWAHVAQHCPHGNP